MRADAERHREADAARGQGLHRRHVEVVEVVVRDDREVDLVQVDAVLALSREVVEQVVWEVVPQLAETIIRENLDRLVKARQG